jgi:hypothetical protein
VTSLYRALREGADETRSDPELSMADYIGQAFGFNGLQYALQGQTLGEKTEDIGANFQGYVERAYKANGIVFACMLTRMLVFSEARFQFRRLILGRPGSLYGTSALRSLEQPWINGTTGDLLTRMIQDVDLAGNFYGVRRPGNRIRRMRPDWVTIMLGSNSDESIDRYDIDAEVIGYLYHPGGPGLRRDPEVFLPQQVAHWAPIPDPLAAYRGMSWITPVVRDILGDQAAATHKLKFFENGATANVAVQFGENVKDPDAFGRWVEAFENQHKGVGDAYKKLYLAAGAEAKVIGADMKQIDFKEVIGKGETRIAAASGVPPVIVGLSEGLEASTYSNYAQARRAFADRTMRPLWRSAAASLAPLISVPAGSELWYDDRDIPFLQEDVKDEAEIHHTNANSIKQLVEAGYEPDSVIRAIDAGDLTLLKHTGLYSVQLQEPGSGDKPALPALPPGDE